MEALIKSASAVAGAVVATTVMHPIDVVQKRIQVQDRHDVLPEERFHGVLDALRKTLRRTGASGLYAGLWVSYVSSVVKNSTFFTLYELLKWAHGTAPLSALLQLGMGVLSAMATSLVTLPLQVVQTQQSVHSNRGNRLSALNALKNVLNDKGLSGLYVGLAPALVLSVYPAIQHLIFDRLKRAYLRRVHGAENAKNGELPAAVSFFFGIAANLIALVFAYPLIYIKVRVQAQKVSKEHHLGSIAMAQKVVAMSGVLGLWKGLQSQLLNACLSNAILYTCREKIQPCVEWSSLGIASNCIKPSFAAKAKRKTTKMKRANEFCYRAECKMFWAARLPKTMHSSNELPPNRFSPCSPPVTSPAAYRPGMGREDASDITWPFSLMTRPPFV